MSGLERHWVHQVDLIHGLRRVSCHLTTIHRRRIERCCLGLGLPDSGTVRRGILGSRLRSGLSRQDHGRMHSRSLGACGCGSGGGHRHAF